MENNVKTKIKGGEIEEKNIPEISYNAWIKNDEKANVNIWLWLFDRTDTIRCGSSWKDKDTNEVVRHDVSVYTTKDEFYNAYKSQTGKKANNLTKSYWEMYHNVKVGDIILACHGRQENKSPIMDAYAWGVITSDYIFNPDDNCFITRNVEWKDESDLALPIKTSVLYFKRLEDVNYISQAIDFFNIPLANKGSHGQVIAPPKTIESESCICSSDIPNFNIWFARDSDESNYDYCMEEKCQAFNNSNSLGDMSEMGSDLEAFSIAAGQEKAVSKSKCLYTYWQLSHEVKENDLIIYFKRPDEIRGWGFVSSAYTYDENKKYHHCVGVDWNCVDVKNSPIKHNSGLWFKDKKYSEVKSLLEFLGIETKHVMENVSNRSGKIRRVWLYDATYGDWNKFLKDGIWGLRNDKCDYSQFASLDDYKKYYYANGGTRTTMLKSNYSLYGFVSVGDIIIVRYGLTELWGYGVVTSEYIFDDSKDYIKSYRKVDWHVSERKIPADIKRQGIWFNEIPAEQYDVMFKLLHISYDTTGDSSRETDNHVKQEKTESKIFISYSRKDKDKVFAIRDEIENVTLQNCWIDLNGIESDEQFEDVIINAINKAEIFIFMYSANSCESRWSKDELRFATKKGKRIVFLRIDDAPLADWYLFKYDGHDIIDYQVEEQKRKVLKNLCDWCGTDSVKSKLEEARRNAMKAELVQLAKNYANKAAELKNDAKEINAKLKLMGITERLCPVCQTGVDVDSDICPECGWTFSPIEGIEGAEFLLNRNQLLLGVLKRKSVENHSDREGQGTGQ